MTLTIDPSSPLPLYYQIREQLRAAIRSGTLKPGDLLPGEAQICAETGVSRMTARQALAQLASEGLVVRQPGRGTFVAAHKTLLPGISDIGLSYTQFMRQAGMNPATRVLKQEVRTADEETARQLRIPLGERVVYLARLRLANGQPIALEHSHLPARLVPGLERINLTNLSLHQVLEQRFGLPVEHATDVLEISTADADVAELLGIPPGTAVALVNSLDYLADETPLVFNRILHRGDRFRVLLRRSRQSHPVN